MLRPKQGVQPFQGSVSLPREAPSLSVCQLLPYIMEPYFKSWWQSKSFLYYTKKVSLSEGE